jgi:capsular exopolysaccharide synthesis family protein
MNDIILDYKVKSYTITDQHPDYYISNIEVETQVASLQALINNYLSYSREQLKKTNERMAEVQQRLNQIPSKERALLNIQRKYTLNDQLYTFLLEKRAEAGIAKASNVAGNQVLDEARSQGAILISPKSRNNNMTALMIGLMIPLGIIFLIDFFNNKIISRSDVEANTNLPIIGDISHNGRSSNIPIIDHPKSVIAETIRGLRTNLQYLLRGQDKKVILLTSNIGGEGKTFCSLNLSASLAISGKKTLVVGLDLRKPRLNNYFGISNETGLTNYLIEKLEIEETIQQTHIDNLYIASSGPIPPNPAELIETSRMDDFMNYARKHFDYIVIDTPPAAIVADAINLGRYADVAIFVVRQRYSRKESLKYINEIAGSHKMDHVNLVVNDIEKPKGYAYGYGYGYGYGYSYGYGYGYGGYHGYYDEEDTMRVSLMDKFVRWVKRR